MSNSTTNCATVLMGTQGVHTQYPFIAGAITPSAGNNDFIYTPGGYFNMAIGINIHNNLSIYDDSTLRTSISASATNPLAFPNFPIANETIGKKGAKYGILAHGVHLDNSLSNRSVQFAVGHAQQSADYSQAPSAINNRPASVPLHAVSFPEVDVTNALINLETPNANQSNDVNGHSLVKFAMKEVHLPSNDGYQIDNWNNIHLGATDRGSSTNINATQYSFYEINTPTNTGGGGA